MKDTRANPTSSAVQRDRIVTERATAFRCGMADAIAGRPPLQRDWDDVCKAMYRDGYRIVAR